MPEISQMFSIALGIYNFDSFPTTTTSSLIEESFVLCVYKAKRASMAWLGYRLDWQGRLSKYALLKLTE